MKIKRWLAVLCAALLSAGIVCQLFAAAADEPLDLNRQCWLTVNPCDSATDKEMYDDLMEADIVIDLYRVAEMKSGQGGYSFATVEPFELISIPQDIAETGWAEVAQMAAAKVLQPSVVEAKWSPAAGSRVELQSGLYLLVAHKRGDTGYVKTVTDDKGASRIATQVKTGKHVYTFAPELVSLPSKLPENGVINTANPGGWIYDLTVNMKPEIDDLNGRLEIVKTLRTYEASAPATFVFQVDWDVDGKHYSEVYSMVFDAPGARRLEIDNLPVGATVTVREVYSGAVYTLVSEPEQTALIEADKTARVEFVNDYEDSPPNGGGSITNRFTFDGNTWNWTTPGDSITDESTEE